MPTAAVVVGVPSAVLTCSWLMPGETCCQVVLLELVAVLGYGLGAGRQRHADQRRQRRGRADQTVQACRYMMRFRSPRPARVAPTPHDSAVPRESVVPPQIDRLSQRPAFCNAAVASAPRPQPPAETEEPRKSDQMLAWLKTMTRSPANCTLSLWLDCDRRRASPSSTPHWGVPDTVQGRFEMIALHLVAGAAPARPRRAGGRAPGQGPDRGVRRGPGRCHARDDLRRPRRAPRGQARHRRAVRPPPRLSCGARRGRRYDACAKRSEAQLAYLGPGGRLGCAADWRIMCAGAPSALDAQPAAQILGGEVAWPRPCRT